jgi:hypothetical protein
MKKCLLFFVLLISCKTKDFSENLSLLKSGEGRISIKVNEKNFYEDTNIFNGEILVFPTLIRLNLSDQSDGNVVISIEDQNLHKSHPINKKLFVDNMTMVNVLFGKISDRALNKGVGYLMGSGNVELLEFNESVLRLKFKGKGGKYENFADSTKWEPIEGEVFIKTPQIKITNIEKNEVFY